MTTFIVIMLGTVGTAVALGAALTVSWLFGMAAGHTVQAAMAGDATAALDDLHSTEPVEDMHALVAESQRMLRDSQRREAFSST